MAEEAAVQWVSVKEVGVASDRNAKHRRTMEVNKVVSFLLSANRMHIRVSTTLRDLKPVVSSAYTMVSTVS